MDEVSPVSEWGGHWALQAAGVDICWAINSHLSFSLEQESGLGAVYRINRVGS